MITVLWGAFLRSRLDWCQLATPRWAGDMFQEQLLGEPLILAHFRSRRAFALSQRSWLVSGTIAMCFFGLQPQGSIGKILSRPPRHKYEDCTLGV